MLVLYYIYENNELKNLGKSDHFSLYKGIKRAFKKVYMCSSFESKQI